MACLTTVVTNNLCPVSWLSLAPSVLLKHWPAWSRLGRRATDWTTPLNHSLRFTPRLVQSSIVVGHYHGSAHSTLNWVIDDCRYFPVWQYRTVVKYGTDTALVKVLNYFCLDIDFAVISLLVLLDLSAAFNHCTLPRHTGKHRLENWVELFGIALNWIKSSLQDRDYLLLIVSFLFTQIHSYRSSPGLDSRASSVQCPLAPIP